MPDVFAPETVEECWDACVDAGAIDMEHADHVSLGDYATRLGLGDDEAAHLGSLVWERLREDGPLEAVLQAFFCGVELGQRLERARA